MDSQLKQRIIDFIEMEHRSGIMEVITPLYLSRNLQISLDDVTEVLKELHQ